MPSYPFIVALTIYCCLYSSSMHSIYLFAFIYLPDCNIMMLGTGVLFEWDVEAVPEDPHKEEIHEWSADFVV